MYKRYAFSPVATLMIGVMLSLQVPMVAQAAMVSSQDIVQTNHLTWDRATLVEKIQQQELQAQLVQMGVDPAVVISRVQNMTDAEVLALNEKIQELPAGEGILGLFIFLLIFFAITDLVGITDVY